MGNSSYSFMPIILKLYRYFVCGLKMCMWLDIILSNFLIHILQVQLPFFTNSAYSFSSAIKVNRLWVRCVRKFSNHPTILWFFWNFTGASVMISRCACFLSYIILIYFLLFFPGYELRHFSAFSATYCFKVYMWANAPTV